MGAASTLYVKNKSEEQVVLTATNQCSGLKLTPEWGAGVILTARLFSSML